MYLIKKERKKKKIKPGDLVIAGPLITSVNYLGFKVSE